MIPALWHEKWVLEQLNERPGTQAFPFGQALLSDDARGALKECETVAGAKTPVRWMPDLLVIHTPSVMFVDAKAGEKWKETQNHVIEQDALQAALRWCDTLLTEVWFI